MKVKVCKLERIKLVTKDKELIVGKETINPILPTYGKEFDACMDIYPIYCEHDDKRDRLIYHTGLAFALPIGCIMGENGGIDIVSTEMSIRPRSNLTKSNWYIPNSPGTLDFGYRGELLIIFKNRTDYRIVQLFRLIHENLVLNENGVKYKEILDNLREDILTPPYKCDGVDRCCQIIINSRPKIVWEEVKSVEELGTTNRGSGGFGSTGGAVK